MTPDHLVPLGEREDARAIPSTPGDGGLQQKAVAWHTQELFWLIWGHHFQSREPEGLVIALNVSFAQSHFLDCRHRPSHLSPIGENSVSLQSLESNNP